MLEWTPVRTRNEAFEGLTKLTVSEGGRNVTALYPSGHFGRNYAGKEDEEESSAQESSKEENRKEEEVTLAGRSSPAEVKRAAPIGLPFFHFRSGVITARVARGRAPRARCDARRDSLRPPAPAVRADRPPPRATPAGESSPSASPGARSGDACRAWQSGRATPRGASRSSRSEAPSFWSSASSIRSATSWVARASTVTTRDTRSFPSTISSECGTSASTQMLRGVFPTGFPSTRAITSGGSLERSILPAALSRTSHGVTPRLAGVITPVVGRYPSRVAVTRAGEAAAT